MKVKVEKIHEYRRVGLSESQCKKTEAQGRAVLPQRRIKVGQVCPPGQLASLVSGTQLRDPGHGTWETSSTAACSLMSSIRAPMRLLVVIFLGKKGFFFRKSGLCDSETPAPVSFWPWEESQSLSSPPTPLSCNFRPFLLPTWLGEV